MHVTGILGQTWAIILIVIGLLSGALSVAREMQVMYAPAKASEKRTYWAWVRIAFVVAATLLWWDEHSKVTQLTAQLSSKPEQTVQVNVPPASIPAPIINIPSQMAYMASTEVSLMAATYKMGDNLAVNGRCQNISPSVVAEEALCMNALRVVDTELNSSKQPVVTKAVTEKLYRQFVQSESSGKIAPQSYGPGEGVFATVYSPSIDSKLDEAFRSGSKTVLFLADYSWKDGAGKHSNQVCKWLQISPQLFVGPGVMAPSGILTWNHCQTHNGLAQQAGNAPK